MYSYKQAKDFEASLISGFSVGEDGMQVGLIIFSGILRIKFDLNCSVDKDAIADKIESVKQLPY